MKMRILGLTLMAFFLFNGAALIAGEHGKYVSSEAKGHTGSMKAYVHANLFGSTSDGDSTSTGDGDSDGDSNSTVDDVTGDLMDGFF